MNPLNPLFAVIILVIAFATGYIIKLKYKINHVAGRFECIDGLRGFLALSVFIHHASIWFQLKEKGTWELPKSNLYIHLGETSVAFFFMITSFLFISKLINSKENEFNWRDFFISRLFRLMPMYYFSLILIIISIMHLSYWQLDVSFMGLLRSIFDWTTFTIIGSSLINNSNYTNMVNAGVTWSLPYEWLFYFSLPIIYLFVSKGKPKRRFLLLSLIFIIFFYNVHEIMLYHIYAFIGGAIAPFILKYTSISSKIKDIYGSIVVLICLYFICQFNTAHNIYCILLISTVFTLIAMGTSLFGLLKNSTLKFLGEICYSTYLLHGIVLFTLFYFIIWFKNLKPISPFNYSLIIFAVTPIVVIVSFLGFRFIEKPFMDKSKKIIKKLNTQKKTNE